MPLRGALYGSVLITQHLHKINKIYLYVVIVNILIAIVSWMALDDLLEYSKRMQDRNVFTRDLSVIGLHPVGDKVLSDSEYQRFFEQCAKKSLTHNVMSFRKTLVTMQESCFTRSGFDAFMSQLNGQSGIFSSINAGSIWNVKSISNVVKVKEGFYKDVYFFQTWSAELHVQRVDMKTDINYVNDILQTKYTMKAMIVRQSNVEFSDGIAIQRLVLE